MWTVSQPGAGAGRADYDANNPTIYFHSLFPEHVKPRVISTLQRKLHSDVRLGAWPWQKTFWVDPEVDARHEQWERELSGEEQGHPYALGGEGPSSADDEAPSPPAGLSREL